MVSKKVIKYVLFTFSFLFCLAGICSLVLSLHVRNNRTDYQITADHLPAINLLIFIGAVTLIMGFLGFCGVIRESLCLLILFFLGLLGMFIMLLAVGALGAVSRSLKARKLLREHLMKMYPLSEQPKEDQESFQEMEKSGFCCGLVDGPLDWGSAALVPDSCDCTDTSRDCTDLDGRQVYSTPCMTFLMTWMNIISRALMGAAFGFGILMVLGMSFCLVLLCQIRKNGVN